MIPPHQIVDPREIIIQGSRLLGIPLANRVVEKMLHHLEVLLLWRAKVNLTAIKDPREIAIRHFLDSLTVFKVIPSVPGLRILDVGTGAGFPGIVLRTVRDTLRVTLLDRDPRKIVFLKRLVRELELGGVAYINSDLKELIDNQDSAQFDIAVSRAFSSDATVLDSLHSLLVAGGLLVVMGGPSFNSGDFFLDHFRASVSWEGLLPFSNSFRRVCLYSKVSG